ncbi:MAG TPA: GGDEF domain-containing phosphodiesterase, partial [Gammaproteobacteria bacterium]
IALVGPQEQDFDTLARCADIAMYRAKRRGNSYAFYVPGEAGEVTSRFALEGELRKALADGTIEVYYQPRINLETGRYDSVEALARWHHPEQGAISPGIFVAIAEESGQVGALGRHVMEVACRDLVAWRKRGIAVRMAVNLSVFELQDPDIVLRIARTLQHHRVDGSWLEIEVTESAAMSDPEANVATLEQLKALGIDLAIDDFGTGYSSLSYLKRLPADFLKIDRSFVDGVTQDDGRSIDADIVRAIIALAQSLELQVIAEGIEEAGQEQFLRRHGCQLAQGFYYCKPQPEAAMLAILEAQLEAGSAG